MSSWSWSSLQSHFEIFLLSDCTSGVLAYHVMPERRRVGRRPWLTCHRGAGIGHSLLRSLVEEADEAGQDVYLTTLQHTDRFYEPQGFSEVSPAAIPR